MKAKYICTFLISFAIVMVLNPFLSTLFLDNVTFIEKLLSPTGILIRIIIATYLSYNYADKLFKN